MDSYFIFKGINSRDMDIIVTKMPSIVKPKRRTNEIEVPGRNGVLHEDLGSFENYTLSIECAMKNRTRKHSFEEVCAWLSGYGELILSVNADKIYRVFINNQIPISGVIRSFSKFLVQFDTYPLKYSVNKADEELELTTGATIYNRGTYFSEPIITVYGSGNINLAINGITYGLQAVNGYITINSEMQEVYKDGINCNSQFIAEDFPIFQCGDNSISWTGNVTKIKIEPNWRWL